MYHLGDRSQTVGGAGRVGDDVVLLGQVGGIVDAHADGDVLPFGGGGNDHLLGAASVNVRYRLFRFSEQARGFDDYLHSQATPVDVARGPHREDLDLLAVGDDGVIGEGDFSRVAAQNRVVLEQVGQHLGRADVVGGDDLEGLVATSSPEDVPADAPEAVDRYSRCQNRSTSRLGRSRPRV